MSRNLSYVPAIIAIVAIVLVVLGFSGGITGKSVEFFRGTPRCTETDSGQDDFLVGVVSIHERDGVREYIDTCFENNMLVQYFCADTVHMNAEGHYCENGCLNGACL